MVHSDTTAGALDGVLVLDLTRILAGPTATQMLGDLGATVIKIENPATGGDDTRTWGPPYVETPTGESDLSAYFLAANRNKHSVAADLGTKDGQAVVRKIAAQAQIVIENYKPGGLAKYGLDYAALSGLNPSLVYCSISGFGQTGPNSHRPGYDLMAQGFGGIMSLTGDPQGDPMKVGVGIADVMCGMNAAIGMLAALRHAEATGIGQHIDIALVDSQMAWLINEGTNYLTSGQTPRRRGNGHPNIVPYDVFPTRDGHFILAVGNDRQFQAMCDAFGLTGLAQDARFRTNPLRIEHRVPLTAALTETFRTFSADDVLAMLQTANVPCGPIHTVDQALQSDQARARDVVVTVPTAEATKGAVDLLGNPLKLSKTPVAYAKAPPRFGADTDRLDDILKAHAESRASQKVQG
ncbi:CaiB/BaiF CoA transferase family protein [Pseudooctadecabacter sp.]|uniref:CaiB/BaiF CoA transferase family protein n=1 Tax=Pseudooctadecabacter sp. TaxID=1966338 RepID=UPI0025FAF6CE|nr:CaiB/BaiF CoA-transferase family protein [Pseudooctadecabacter sp.]